MTTTPKNTVRIGSKPARAYFRALETAATQHDTINIESRGKHVHKANDITNEFCKRYNAWTLTDRTLTSVEYHDRSVSELTLKIIRTKEETR